MCAVFPEMRAQLRTYHSIPSLQARQDPNAYKQLQDAPRLKSILKGATEDEEQPSTVEDIKNHPVPRTNPVNLIFVLSQYAPKISELHFFPPRDFFDLVMRSNLSSRSRATAFLWLMWWYLESDFSKEAAEANPFGPGQYGPPGDPATSGYPIKCPAFDFLTPEQEALENVDTVEEKNFGEIKRKERIAILGSDMAPVVTGPKRSSKKGEFSLYFMSTKRSNAMLSTFFFPSMLEKAKSFDVRTKSYVDWKDRRKSKLNSPHSSDLPSPAGPLHFSRFRFPTPTLSNTAPAFNQNPVFSVLADDGASTPGRDRQSPSHGKILLPVKQSPRGHTNNRQALHEVVASWPNTS